MRLLYVRFRQSFFLKHANVRYAACCLCVPWLIYFTHFPNPWHRGSEEYDDSDSESEDPFTSHQARRQTARGSQRGALPPFYNYQGAGWTSPFSSAPPLPWVTHAQTRRQTDRMRQWITCVYSFYAVWVSDNLHRILCMYDRSCRLVLEGGGN